MRKNREFNRSFVSFIFFYFNLYLLIIMYSSFNLLTNSFLVLSRHVRELIHLAQKFKAQHIVKEICKNIMGSMNSNNWLSFHLSPHLQTTESHSLGSVAETIDNPFQNQGIVTSTITSLVACSFC